MAGYKYTFAKFFKDWALVFGMMVGIASFFVYRAVPALYPIGPAIASAIRILQPMLLFTMLFISFSKIEPHQMRPHKWMLWLLLVQCVSYLVLAGVLMLFPNFIFRIGLEAAMLCMVCPTAAACAVITGKLGGNMAGVMTYTILMNIATAVLVPLVNPIIHPMEGLSFYSAFAQILAKVFPMLIMPAVCAWIVRYLFPKLNAWIVAHAEISFYLWICSLTLAILMSTRALVNSTDGARVIIDIAIATLATCALQFFLGKRIGSRYRCSISAGQSIGQKNTVFAIWMAYTFMTPVVSVAGGLYSIWQNCYNSYQLYRKRITKNQVQE